MKAGALKAILFCLAVGLMGVVVAAFPFSLKLEENVGLNLLFRMRGATAPPEEVVVVAIGRNSARALDLPAEVDKWPREIHARLVRRLYAAGAAVIAFDMMFDERRTSEGDADFARAIATAGNVILAQVLVQDRLPVKDRDDRAMGYANIEKLIVPIPLLAEAALGEAPFPLPKIPISLKQFWTFKTSAGDIPTLPVAALHAYGWKAHDRLLRLVHQRYPDTGIDPAVLEREAFSLEKRLQVATALHRLMHNAPDMADQLATALGGAPDMAPARRRHELLQMFIALYRGASSRYLNFYGPAGSLRSIPYHHVVGHRERPSGPGHDFDVRGKAVFVGLKEGAWGQVKDGFYTVFSQADGTDISGVEIAATAFANLRMRNSIRHLGRWGHLALVLAWGIAAALMCLRFSVYLSAVALLGAGGCYTWVAVHLFSTQQVWLPLAVPLLVQSPVAYFAVLLRRHHRLTLERRNIREAFGYYLPDEVVDRLSRNINYVHDGGQMLYGICLFTDAQKYTPLSESLDPVELTRLMNQYYEAIFQPVKENDGIILQVVGDSVLSIWASPRPDAALQAKACAAALAIGRATLPTADDGARADYRLPTRIGLHAGYILLGNIGAMNHYEYRPVGDIVNTASRLEGLNKHLGTWILASDEVLDDVNGLVTRDMGKFLFVGKSKPINVRELVVPGYSAEDRRITAHESFVQGLEAFNSQAWTDARACFSRSLGLLGGDGPSQFYIDLCDAYQQRPPGADWDGSIVLKKK